MEAKRAKRVKTKNCSSYKVLGEGKTVQGNEKEKFTIYGAKKG